MLAGFINYIEYEEVNKLHSDKDSEVRFVSTSVVIVKKHIIDPAEVP